MESSVGPEVTHRVQAATAWGRACPSPDADVSAQAFDVVVFLAAAAKVETTGVPLP
jgi:hypothetical protein